MKNENRQPCEIFTRVMGYYRPVSHFNEGKKSEFYSRKYYKQNEEFIKQYGNKSKLIDSEVLNENIQDNKLKELKQEKTLLEQYLDFTPAEEFKIIKQALYFLNRNYYDKK